jgi:hypothetical protein
VTDSTQSERTDAAAVARRRSLIVIAASILLLVGSATGGYLFGRDLARKPLDDARQLIAQLQPQTQKLKSEVLVQNAKVISLQSELASVKKVLDEIRPAKNTYNVNANGSLIVGGGHLTIGLIGPPANEYVDVNVNGKTRRAVAGDAITVSPDPATTCTVKVQSFDMFAARIYAACNPAAKPQ